MNMESDDSMIRITYENGDFIELSKDTDRVTTSEDIEYTILNKLMKALRRERNKASFSIDYYED